MPASLPFAALARAAGRFERGHGVPAATAAGWSDAEALGVRWLPNVLDPPDVASSAVAEADLLFFGNLSYEPNVAALETLRRVWPAVQRRRPGTTLLVAGAGGDAVRAGAPPHGWIVEGRFDDVARLCGRARVAVAPLHHASGIQNKVLEAAAAGLPQVLTPQAAAGLRPGFPCVLADGDDALADALVELLEDPARASALGAQARDEILSTYVPAAWADTVRDLLATAR
jgi:glycosyltransferase involved in cell wall biosynthesis